MIIVSYIYDFEVVCEYKRTGDEGRDIVLPRRDEFVDIDNLLYRVDTITHVLRNNNDDTSEQQIIIKLTRQLAIRSI